jgi:NAD(P)-dependent dehydrogenase (short-subunit alcohol dehydrogenase family)
MAKQKSSMFGIPDPNVRLDPTPVDQLDLKGRWLAVVGGTDGLGRAIARLAAARGAAVTVVGRTFRDQGVSGVTFLQADLASMKEAARLGRELPVQGLDTVVFTTGIIAAKTREQTAEGLERDMAISYLSRLTAVSELAPRLEAAKAARPPRVFIMGFPGTGQLGDVTDLNSERRYRAMDAHTNTVAGNEALVLDGARRYPGLRFFGLNPGLIKTNIRSNMLGEGSLAHRATEFLIGLLMPSAETYAGRVLPTLFAPELDAHSGVMIGARGRPIQPTAGMTEQYVSQFIAESEALVARAQGR